MPTKLFYDKKTNKYSNKIRDLKMDWCPFRQPIYVLVWMYSRCTMDVQWTFVYIANIHPRMDVQWTSLLCPWTYGS